MAGAVEDVTGMAGRALASLQPIAVAAVDTVRDFFTGGKTEAHQEVMVAAAEQKTAAPSPMVAYQQAHATTIAAESTSAITVAAVPKQEIAVALVGMKKTGKKAIEVTAQHNAP